ncbi:MAG: haloacid dehalogenase-like hydrolase [Gemmatimonadales bacterium]|nr:haloacid dehalogenase-like hydrolase [Gemmatimonadales bacterium]
MTRRLVLFDIDGTLLHSGGAGRRAIMRAMADILPDSEGTSTVRFDGKTDPQIVTELLAAGGDPEPGNPARIAEVLDRYVACLEHELGAGSPPSEVLPGIFDLLDSLERESAVVVGLLTGNVAPGAHLKLQAAGIAPTRFRVGAFGSDSPHRPALPPIAAERARQHFGRVPTGHEVVIIGDTPADVTCGASIRARAIAVATGGYSMAELEAHRPWRTYADLADTAEVLEAILGDG